MSLRKSIIAKSVFEPVTVVACHLPHPSLQGAAHGDPGQQFHALRARLFDDLAVRVVGQSLRLSNDLVQAEQIDLCVDEASPRSIELMGEPVGSDHYDLHILRITLDHPQWLGRVSSIWLRLAGMLYN